MDWSMLLFSLLVLFKFRYLKFPFNINFILVPPDGGYYAWMVVFAAFITNFLSDGVFFSFGKLIGEISEHLNRSQSEIASIFSAMTAFYYISGPFASAFVNRYGFRLAGTLGVLTSSVCVGLSSISNSYLTLLVLHAIGKFHCPF